MNNNELMMILLAFALGYMFSGILKQLSGCQVIEGLDDDDEYNETSLDNNGVSIPTKGQGTYKTGPGEYMYDINRDKEDIQDSIITKLNSLLDEKDKISTIEKRIDYSQCGRQGENNRKDGFYPCMRCKLPPGAKGIINQRNGGCDPNLKIDDTLAEQFNVNTAGNPGSNYSFVPAGGKTGCGSANGKCGVVCNSQGKSNPDAGMLCSM
uniref:Uncharacterized protein n=1 Tax=viral metagenome TaxID=1070528 RepID=A0A6C0BT73_9ZZZZ